MASVYKDKSKGDKWYASWFDHNGKRRTKCTFTTDIKAAKRIAAKYEADAALRREGVVDSNQDRFGAESRREISHHLADYKASLVAKNRDDEYVAQNDSRATAVIAACKARVLADLTASAVQDAIGKMRDDGTSLATCNTYIRSIKGFTKWLARDRRIPIDPLAFIELFNEATDRRVIRRVISEAELTRLYIAAEAFVAPSNAISGIDRAMLYRVAAGTGFRAGELRSLTSECFKLEGSEPTITVEATHSKRRRTDVQPISSELARQLRPWLKGKEVGKPVFAKMSKDHTARMLRRDLAAARKAWIKEAGDDAKEVEYRQKSDFLCYRNAAGEVADFHATRHTYVSNIVESGATVREAQELARHSTPNLTIGRYAHVQRGKLHQVVDSLESKGSATGSSQGAKQREMVRRNATNVHGDDRNSPRGKTAKTPGKTNKSSSFSVAEGTGLEPATPCGAPHFQCAPGLLQDSTW